MEKLKWGVFVAVMALAAVMMVHPEWTHAQYTPPNGGGSGGSCGSLGGDVTGTCAANTAAKVNGGSIPASAASVGTNSSGQFVAVTNQPSGTVVCASTVDTDESTNSVTNVDLTTPDTCTFTLAAQSTVLIRYMHDGYATSAGNGFVSVNVVNIAAADVTATARAVTWVCGSCQGDASLEYLKTSLAAGSQTVKIRHRVVGSTTGHWLLRVLSITIVSVP